MRDIRDSTQKYLMNMIHMMKERELTKRNILKLQQLEFEAEISSIKGEKINVEDRYKEFVKNLPKPVKPTPIAISPAKGTVTTKEKEHQLVESTSIPNIACEKTDSSLDLTKLKKPSNIQDKRNRQKQIKAEKSQYQQPTSVVNKVEQKKVEKPQVQSNIVLKNRIRFNKYNDLVIDRYIQNPNSFNPFDDDFNKLVGTKIFREDFGKNYF